MSVVWKKIERKLSAGIGVMLMVVVKSEGSSPGKAGFKMMVAKDGTTYGSVGGGVMEFNLVKKSLRLLEEGQSRVFLKVQEHNKASGKESSGLVCSGVQHIAFYPLSGQDVTLVREILEIAESKSNHRVIFTEKGITVDKEPAGEEKSLVNEKVWFYSERPGLQETLYIFGGGHVSLALSQMMKLLGFRVLVFDDREEVDTMKQNTYADEIRVAEYAQAGDLVPDGNHVYVAIMTYGHKQDYKVLVQMLNKKIRYLGMMGSENKVKGVYETLENDGYDTEEIARFLDAPIGLEINSITPMEIAVSVAAKIISVKNR
jgi:xanthine dehydrogenase accessory factor